MISNLAAPLGALILSIAGVLLHHKIPLLGIILTHVAAISSGFITSKKNLFSTRILHYLTLLILGYLLFLTVRSPLFLILPPVLGLLWMPNEFTFRTKAAGFKGVNLATYISGAISVPSLAYAWIVYPENFWTLAPIFLFSFVLVFFTIMGQNWLTSNRKSSWKVKIGDTVPDFKANKRGNKGPFKLSDERGRYVMLNFIRGDWCPVCQVHMQIFRKESNRLKENKVKLLVASRDSGPAAEKFANQVGLEYDLLEDPELELAGLFGAIDQKTKNKGQVVPLPVSFLIGPDGKLEYASKPDDLMNFLDPNEVLGMIRKSLPSEKQ